MVLPVQRTHRHYLTVCLITGIGLMSLAFMVPLGSKPDVCHDAITPNDMHSDLSCAFSGSLLTFGGFAAVMWVFLRSLSLHLQICWQMVPGKKFAICAYLAGWGVPAISLALLLTLTGVSYRFGSTCHVNHDNSMATFWGPMLAFAGAATILQFSTFGYCIRVYVRSLIYPEETSQNSSNLPSYQGSTRTVTARAAYRRVRKVIALQWRGIIVVLLIIVDVVFFAVIFIKMDNTTTAEAEDANNELPWLVCLIANAGNKNACLSLASSIVLSEATVMAVLILLSLNGYWSVMFLGRWSMVQGWVELIQRPFRNSHDFVSVDARRLSDPRNYEMLTSPPKAAYLPKSFDDFSTSPEVEDLSPRVWSPQLQQSNGYFGKEAAYRSPSLSFSTPKPPSRPGSDARIGSPQGRVQMAPTWEKQAVAPPPPILERTESSAGNTRLGSALGADRSTSALGREQSGSVPGRERSESTQAADRSGSALGRDWDRRSLHQRERTSPTPRRSNSALGKGDWDPIATYARGGIRMSPDHTNPGTGCQWDSTSSYARGGIDQSGRPA
ncbi:hypothetical protein MMC26_006708 [Xylographa opegraphella]|nr:hypothetical protein [Xylographa opegraphella]